MIATVWVGRDGYRIDVSKTPSPGDSISVGAGVFRVESVAYWVRRDTIVDYAAGNLAILHAE